MVSVKIIEQPSEKCYFRYGSDESADDGPILGASSTERKIVYPKIRIKGYVGVVHILVSCVEQDMLYRQHPHKIYLTTSSRDEKRVLGGALVMEEQVLGSKDVEIRNIGIQFVNRSDMADSLIERMENKIKPFESNWDNVSRPMELHTVRLCFHVVGRVNGKSETIGIAVSDPIVDQKFLKRSAGGASSIWNRYYNIHQ